jgi:hypothetical protein
MGRIPCILCYRTNLRTEFIPGLEKSFDGVMGADRRSLLMLTSEPAHLLVLCANHGFRSFE